MTIANIAHIVDTDHIANIVTVKNIADYVDMTHIAHILQLAAIVDMVVSEILWILKT